MAIIPSSKPPLRKGVFLLSPSRLAEIRSHFPVLRKKIYLNSCSQGPLSDAVRGGFEEYMRTWDAQGSPWEAWIEEYEAARASFARFIHAEPDEVAILPSVSAGVNSVASAFDYRDRNGVALGEFDFPTMGHVWLSQQARGAKVEFVAAEGDRLPGERYEAVVGRKTLIVPVAHMCFKNGWRAELPKIVSIARDAGALTMLDDYQDCGTRPVDVKAMGLDMYVGGTLKYLLGPPGFAFMYVSPELIDRLKPTISGWFSQANPFAFDVKLLDPSPTARKFEAGTPGIPSIYGARQGLEFLMSIGMSEVAEHIASLTTAALSRAKAMGIQTKTAANSVGPLVVLRCVDAATLVERLAKREIVVSNRHDGLRLGMHVYNTMEDLDALFDALADNAELLMFDK
jgi:selenocysteine lyase/cysteine desulfurase